MAACVLALLVVAPTVGAGICLCDGGVATSTATSRVSQADEHRDSAPCDAACCLGGHCHHGGAMLDALVSAVPTPTPGVAEHMRPAVYGLASRTTTGPDRPPRA